MGEMAELLKNYVQDTTKKLVDAPEEVEVNVTVSTKTVIVQLRVEKPDTGKVIGKKGRTIEALKILALAIKNTHFPEDSRRVLLEVLEDERSRFTYRD